MGPNCKTKESYEIITVKKQKTKRIKKILFKGD